MTILADINAGQTRITTRTIAENAQLIDTVRECESYLRDGGEKLGIACPPLRVRETQKEVTLTADADGTADLPDGFLSSIFVSPVEDRKIRIRWTPLEQFRIEETTYPNGTDSYSHFGNKLFLSKKHNQVLLGYHCPLSSVIDDEPNWVWETDKEVYIYFVASRVLQNARNQQQATSWFNEFSSKIARLNRTYGDGAFTKGARARYRGAGQIGRRYPAYY